jgi:glycosyltransferase involved in cell wall biosynthesis
MMVMPSIFESLGLAAAEAMSYSKPVVASETGGLPEVVGNGGLLVPAKDPERLSEAINRLLRDDTLRHDLGSKAKERAAQYSWDLATEKIEKIYTSLVAGSNNEVNGFKKR